MFYDDAICASKELSLTLTGRGKDSNRIPMCGVPFHAAENYISKLEMKIEKECVKAEKKYGEKFKKATFSF